ncbi:glycosyl hydrolase family 2, sugar binding domain protein [Bacteroidales bacterium KA00344]|nr:glycosyl hydrolase family 2, sugar binding domain protein [Bacteroidales bacterium KA00344]
MNRKNRRVCVAIAKPSLWMVLLWVCLCSVNASARTRQLFDADWLFCLDDKIEMAQQTYDDSGWHKLNLPHDWAIEGDFSVNNPSGAGGGALPGGVGWYRKHFNVASINPQRRVFLAFDGVYMNSTVYVNGQEVGHRPYGYSSFEYDITRFLKPGDNVIAVKVDNGDQPNSRWYSGCGIYRHVWLTTTEALHFERWGIQVVTTPNGGVTVNAQYVDETQRGARPVIRHTIYDKRGKTVAKTMSRSGSQRMKVRQPQLWSMDNPYVYTVKSELVVNGKTVDELTTTTGFRDFRFDAATGFWLNGRNIKLNGVCEHHDLGCLGAAFYEDAMHRKLFKLKGMGVNALRCTHNPPAPEVLDMCDTMGIVVIDESFDMWRRKKTRNDYARFFDEWHERDLADLVKRDRNHPSILAWSIGNEVLEQWSSAEADELTLEQANLLLNAGHKVEVSDSVHPNAILTQHLADIVRRHDGTRPITAGCNEPSPDNHLLKSGAIDLVGFNYHHQWIKDVPQNFPDKPFYMSESVSALQTRGFYPQQGDTILMMPARWDKPYTDPTLMCSAYDNQHVPWGSTHEQTWNAVKHTPYCFGQFIWTGFDYIGEPTPYSFPARSSYFGIVDLAGFPKDVYYMYQSEWTQRDVLHLFPHWNWLPGQTVDMWCYYNNADEVELFVNEKSQGIRRKTTPAPASERYTLPLKINSEATEFHVAWRVKFEPGEVKVVARRDGREVGSKVIRTAGAPHHIRLTVDYDGRQYHHVRTDGAIADAIRDLVFINAEVVDRDGNLCPNAENQLFFDVEGGDIAGVDNGSQISQERFKANHRKTFFGKCMIVVAPEGQKALKIKAQAVDLEPAELTIQ